MASRKRTAAKPAPKPKAPKTVNRAALAELFGVSLPTVDAWRRRGVPQVEAGRGQIGFIPRDVVAWLLDREREQSAKHELEISLVELERRRALADTELAELRLARERAEVTPNDIAVGLIAAEYEAVRAKIQAIPGRYASSLARLKTSPKTKAALREIAIEILSELSDPGDVCERARERGAD